MTRISRLLFCLICAGANALATAAPQEVAPAGFGAANAQFQAALGGDGKARDAAIDAFHALAASSPGHPLLTAYEGAAVALRGRDALMPWDKMKYAEKGADVIEKALAQLTAAHDDALFGGTPESIATRLVAANTLLALPDFMNRRAAGKRALDAALASPVLALATPEVRTDLLLSAAKVAGADQRGPAEIALLKQVVQLAPQSPQAHKANARLKELGQ
jgi:hypothetical protein